MTLVVVNKGTKKHALAIMGKTMSPKRTPTIAVGKTDAAHDHARGRQVPHLGSRDEQHESREVHHRQGARHQGLVQQRHERLDGSGGSYGGSGSGCRSQPGVRRHGRDRARHDGSRHGRLRPHVTSLPRPVRRAVIFGAPFLAYLIGVAHPARLVVGESDRLFLAIHLGFPFVICLLAWALYLLVDGVENRAATPARVLVIPFAVAYTAFESFAGIARGAFVWKANDLPLDRQQNAAELISSVTHSGLARPLWLTATALWLAAALSVVVALRRRAPVPALVLLAAGALLFGMTPRQAVGPGRHGGVPRRLGLGRAAREPRSRAGPGGRARAEHNVGAVSPTQPRR